VTFVTGNVTQGSEQQGETRGSGSVRDYDENLTGNWRNARRSDNNQRFSFFDFPYPGSSAGTSIADLGGNVSGLLSEPAVVTLYHNDIRNKQDLRLFPEKYLKFFADSPKQPGMVAGEFIAAQHQAKEEMKNVGHLFTKMKEREELSFAPDDYFLGVDEKAAARAATASDMTGIVCDEFRLKDFAKVASNGLKHNYLCALRGCLLGGVLGLKEYLRIEDVTLIKYLFEDAAAWFFEEVLNEWACDLHRASLFSLWEKRKPRRFKAHAQVRQVKQQPGGRHTAGEVEKENKDDGGVKGSARGGNNVCLGYLEGTCTETSV
jgi:hypothetical protein